MDIKEVKKVLETHLQHANRTFHFDEEKSMLRVEHTGLKKGVDLDLSRLSAKFEKDKEQAVEETVHFINTSFEAMEKKVRLNGREKWIYPVIRSTSFPTETKGGQALVYDEHTAETRIYYVLDMGNAYTMIEEETLHAEGMTTTELREAALFNVRSLDAPLKEDQVAGNRFYFLNTNDGYDASRILNKGLLSQMADQAEGQLAVAVPHQDVLIFADVVNDQGYDVLGQLAFRFFGDGRVPITALPFLYENGELESVFIMARKKPKQ